MPLPLKIQEISMLYSLLWNFIFNVLPLFEDLSSNVYSHKQHLGYENPNYCETNLYL